VKKKKQTSEKQTSKKKKQRTADETEKQKYSRRNEKTSIRQMNHKNEPKHPFLQNHTKPERPVSQNLLFEIGKNGVQFFSENPEKRCFFFCSTPRKRDFRNKSN